MAHNHIKEETLVDYTLGKLNEEEANTVENHLSTCDACQETWKYWKQVLTTETQPIPSENLRKKLTESTNDNEEKTTRKNWRKYGFTATALASMFILFIGLYPLLKNKPITENGEQEYIVAQNEQIPDEILRNKQGTSRLDVQPVANHEQISGDVIFNEATNEIIVRVDGLKPLQTNDYQIWLIDRFDNSNGDLLQLQEGSVRIYYKVPDLKLLKYIKMSIEPQGGSVNPSGPETFHVDFEDQL